MKWIQPLCPQHAPNRLRIGKLSITLAHIFFFFPFSWRLLGNVDLSANTQLWVQQDFFALFTMFFHFWRSIIVFLATFMFIRWFLRSFSMFLSHVFFGAARCTLQCSGFSLQRSLWGSRLVLILQTWPNHCSLRFCICSSINGWLSTLQSLLNKLVYQKIIHWNTFFLYFKKKIQFIIIS